MSEDGVLLNSYDLRWWWRPEPGHAGQYEKGCLQRLVLSRQQSTFRIRLI